jgi:hypothetical protein
MLSRALLLALVACTCLFSSVHADVQYTIYDGIPEPFYAYGSINTSHQASLPNTDSNGNQLYYMATNLPAQRHEILYQFTCLFYVNSGFSTSSLTLHIVRHDNTSSDASSITFIRSQNISGVESGKPIELLPYQMELQIGDFIAVSSLDGSINFRAGPNNIGLPVSYGVISVPKANSAHVLDATTSAPYQTTYQIAAATSSEYMQLCSAFGTYGFFGPYSDLEWSDLYMFAARDIVSPIDNGKAITQFRIGISISTPTFDQLAAGMKAGDNYTGSSAVVEIVVAVPFVVAGQTFYKLDSTRIRTLSGVSHDHWYTIDVSQQVTLAAGELVGFRIHPGSEGLQLRPQWSRLTVAAEEYLTFDSQHPIIGAPEGTLLAAVDTYDTPNFQFQLGTKGGSNINGDPQFAGFHGQQFQFHGLADEVFNLISTPTMQLNSHFVYLSSGKCDYNQTMCWSHPGTYVDALGFTIPSAKGDMQIKMVAGSHEKGLRVWMGPVGGDMHEVHLGSHTAGFRWPISNDSSAVATLQYNVFGEASVHTPLLDIRVVNSDYFFNMEVSLLDQAILRAGAKKHTVTDREICHQDQNGQAQIEHAEHQHGMVEAALMKKYHTDYPLHGLIGQTWRNVLVCGKHWMGAVNDYVVNSLFSDDYYFNYYKRA